MMILTQVAVGTSELAIPVTAIGLIVWAFVLSALLRCRGTAVSDNHRPRVHFIVLVLGTALYLFRYPGMLTISDGVPEANIVDIQTLCKNSILYLVFVVLVFGHAILWRLPSAGTRGADDDGGGL